MSTIDDKIFLTRNYKTVETSLSKPLVKTELHKHFQKIIGSDRLMTAIGEIHPGETVYFGDKENSTDQVPIYRLTELNALDVRKSIKETHVVQPSWAHANKPLYWVMMMIIRYHTITKNEEYTKMAVLFMAVAMYAGLQFRYFRRFYQPNVMSYAINTLSDKFTLKQEGTMIKTILMISWRSHLKYQDDLKDGSDINLLKYLVSMWGRLNSMVKSLKNHYEETKTSGNYLNQSKLTHDDGSTVDRDTDSGRIQSLVDKISEAFFSEPIPPKLIIIASQITEVPRQSLFLAISNIRASNVKEIYDIIQLIIEIFFDETNSTTSDIRTKNFFLFSNSVYLRSNSADVRVMRLKEILDNILKEHSPQYLKTNRDATKGLFRKAIFIVIVLFIQMKS
jgi:hypothetical protein